MKHKIVNTLDIEYYILANVNASIRVVFLLSISHIFGQLNICLSYTWFKLGTSIRNKFTYERYPKIPCTEPITIKVIKVFSVILSEFYTTSVILFLTRTKEFCVYYISLF